MEPLSVAASIIGILATSAKIVTVVTALVRRDQDIPQSLHRVLTEVSELNTCLAQLAPFIQGAKSTERGRKDLVSLEQVVVISTSLVLNMSELEKTLDSYNLDDKMSKFNRIRWMMDEIRILEILNSVRDSKASLNLILTIFTCTALGDAQASITRLHTSVERILENSIDVSQRLARMEDPFATSTVQGEPHGVNTSTSSLKADNDTSAYENRNPGAQDQSRDVVHDAQSLREVGATSKINAGEGRDDVHLGQRSRGSFAQFDKDLEHDLHTSWVYSRSADRHSTSSLLSKIDSSTGMSLLSAVSLAQVSNISVFKLPVLFNEIWNHHHYHDKIMAGKSLLIGSKHSGATTLMKQMQIIGADRIPWKEKNEHRKILLDNLFASFNIAIEEMSHLGLQYERKTSICHAQTLHKIKDYKFDDLSHKQTLHKIEGFEFDDPVPQHFLLAMKQLFADKGFQKAVEFGKDFGLYDNFQYCMDNIDRLASSGNVTTDQDVLRSRVRPTDQFIYTVLDLPSLKLSAIDTYHTRLQREMWLQIFDGVHCFIYVAPLSGYADALIDDSTANHMLEALLLFESITSIACFKSSSIVVLLTKVDLFEKKLPHSPLRKYFPDYTGVDSDSESAKEFFVQRFLSLSHEETGTIHVRCVNATNTDQIREELRKIEDIVSDAIAKEKSDLPQVPERGGGIE